MAVRFVNVHRIVEDRRRVLPSHSGRSGLTPLWGPLPPWGVGSAASVGPSPSVGSATSVGSIPSVVPDPSGGSATRAYEAAASREAADPTEGSDPSVPSALAEPGGGPQRCDAHSQIGQPRPSLLYHLKLHTFREHFLKKCQHYPTQK